MIGALYDRESIFEVEITSNEVNRPLLFYFLPASMTMGDNSGQLPVTCYPIFIYVGVSE